MIVAIHQPSYLPWLGYLDRMARADLFVVLDHVQFERGNYQNRALIRMNGEPRWLTVPVVQRSQKERILEKEIDNRLEGTRSWAPIHFSTLRHAYRDAPYVGLYARALKPIFEARWERLVDLDMALLELLRDVLGIRTPLVMSSDLCVEGMKSELILNLCRELGADGFLGGMGGSRRYLDTAAFDRAGIEVRWQAFHHPIYPQCGTAPFIPGLSALDLLFNCGPQSRDVLLGRSEAMQESLAEA
jgi:WbqC-like protein family